MCFSATASFAVAAGTGVVGTFTLAHVRSARELPLAIVPLVFAVQQAVEGLLWLLLEGGGRDALVGFAATTFAVFALVVWPVLASLAPLLIEARPGRVRVLSILFALSLGLSGYFLVVIIGHPYGVAIAGHSLQYDNGVVYPGLPRLAYVLATCAPLLVSSHRAMRLLGVTVSVGLAVSLAVYYDALFSVWCFFAAASSVLVYAHFAVFRARGLAA
ncbi:MAG: hypothetical protein JNL66_20195 [Alphaproteobacteria bacterium]|nr:hypothetical protein [Alphaproteobacteria bacterium]